MSDLSSEKAPFHLSDLALDRLLSGEASKEARVPVDVHLAACEPCRERHAAISARRAAFLERVPTFDALAASVHTTRNRPSPGARRIGRRALAVAGLATAAGVVLIVKLTPTPIEVSGTTGANTPAAPTDTRPKGGASIAFFLRRGETVTEGGPDTVLRPGDQIRFVYSTARPQYLAILNRDARGVSVYFPSGSHAAAIAPGRGVPLDFGVELDGYVGRERVFALFCDAPIALDPVKRELGTTRTFDPPPGCIVRTLDLQKGPTP
jgi:hypothetical protein